MYLDWSVIVPVAQVVCTVGGFVLVWLKVRQMREVSAYGLLRDEVKRFNTPEMRSCRARLARTLLLDRRDFQRIGEDGDELLGFFEDVGLLLRRRVVPPYFIWSMLSDLILKYGQPLSAYVGWLRQSTNNATYYQDFEPLRNRMAALHKKRTGLVAMYSDSDLREFL
jgi:hypothetical protein